MMFLPLTPCFANVHVGGHVCTTSIVLRLFFPHSPLQQVQTSVWDVSSPFKIVLLNASKVNAEETAKVNAPSTTCWAKMLIQGLFGFNHKAPFGSMHTLILPLQTLCTKV